MNDVIISIINYNSIEYTKKCVHSILEKTANSITYEIIIIDNNSFNSEYFKLSEYFKDYKNISVIESKINKGFSGGHLFGYDFAAPGKYYLILNNDTYFINDVLQILLDFANNNNDAGLLTGQMLNSKLQPINSFSYILTPARRLLGPYLLKMGNKESFPDRKKRYTEPIIVPSITGSFMFIKNSLYQEIGGLDSAFFLFCEEEDLSLRVRKAGKKIYLVPSAQFVHFEGKSRTSDYPVKREYYISLVHFQRKHFSFIGNSILRILTTIKLIFRVRRELYYFRIALFYLIGAPVKYSLRYKQKFKVLSP